MAARLASVKLAYALATALALGFLGATAYQVHQPEPHPVLICMNVAPGLVACADATRHELPTPGVRTGGH